MNRAGITSRRLGRADFVHLAARQVRLVADRVALPVMRDGEPEDIEIDAGGQCDYGHTRVTIGALGGQAESRLAPLPRPGAAAAVLALPRWLGSLRTRAQA